MLRGKKIELRTLEISDLDFLEKIENNERKKFTRDELLNYIGNSNQKIEIAKQFRFVILRNNIPVGFIDLFNYNKLNVGIGIIIDERYHKKGFASESIKILSEYVFKELKVNKIISNVHRDNLKSIRLFKKCGFKLNSSFVHEEIVELNINQ